MALFGASRPDHPMADVDQARKLVAQLPAHDCVKALEEATGWFESIVRIQKFRLSERYALYDLIDQATRSHQRRLAQEDRAYADQTGYQQQARWRAGLQFWKALGAAYIQCIDQLQAGANAAGAVKKDLAAIAARALRALALQLKAVLLHYGPVDPSLWSSLGRIYRYAELQGAVTTPVEVYPGSHESTTVQREFLKAMMLGMSSMQALTPVRQELAEHVVAHFGPSFALGASPAPHYNYCFDVEGDQPPTRRRAGMQVVSESVRYFGATRALPGLAQLVEQTRSREAVPSDINLGGTYDPAAVLPVFEHLARYWSERPPTRRSERRKIATRLTVVRGFRAMIGTLTEADDDSLDFETLAERETWMVEDVSEGGLGALLPEAQEETAKVGNLVGVQSDSASGWSIALVRRLTCERSGRRRAGLQLLHRSAIQVELSLASRMPSAAGMHVNDRALLLSTTADSNGEIPLLVREGGYARGQVLEMKARGKSFEVVGARLIEGGEDYDWAMYRIVPRAELRPRTPEPAHAAL